MKTAFIVALLQLSVAFQAPLDPGSLQGRLLARDAQIDNASITFERIEPGRDVCNCRLTIRDTETTFEQDVFPVDEHGAKQAKGLLRWGDAHGLERTLHTYPGQIISGEYVNGRRVEGEPLTIAEETKSPPAPNTHLGIRRLQTEFAMGFGFGKRILSVDKVESKGTAFEVHCHLDPLQCSCPSYVTEITALLQLSEDLIVRSAVITTDYLGGKGRRELRVSNTGIFPLKGAGIAIAQEGSVKELLMRADDSGAFQRVSGGEVFELVVSSAEMNLTSERYRELSEIDFSKANAIVGLITDGRHPNSPSANSSAMGLPISVVTIGTFTLLLFSVTTYFLYTKGKQEKRN